MKCDLHFDFVFLRRGLCVKPKIKLCYKERSKPYISFLTFHVKTHQMCTCIAFVLELLTVAAQCGSLENR